MIDLWSGAMVVGGSDAVAVVSPSHPSNGFCVKVAQDGGQVCIRRLLENDSVDTLTGSVSCCGMGSIKRSSFRPSDSVFARPYTLRTRR